MYTVKRAHETKNLTLSEVLTPKFIDIFDQVPISATECALKKSFQSLERQNLLRETFYSWVHSVKTSLDFS
jgi:hypothetical protein